MNPYLTINEIIESRALSMPVGQWFTVAQINNKEHDSRCWLYFSDMVHKRVVRSSDGAHLIQSDEWYFSWQKQEAS